MSQTTLDEEALELVAYRFKLLSDPMRLKILNILQKGELSVSDIVAEAGTSQPNVSKHLSSLKNAGLVKRRQEANQAYFSIAAPFIFELCDIVCSSISEDLNLQIKRFN